MGGRFSNRDNFHAGRKPKFAEKFFAVFPRESERADVSNAETGDNMRKRGNITLGKLAIHQRALRPIHQLRQGGLMVKIRGYFVSDCLPCDCHGSLFYAFRRPLSTGNFSWVSTSLPWSS